MRGKTKGWWLSVLAVTALLEWGPFVAASGAENVVIKIATQVGRGKDVRFIEMGTAGPAWRDRPRFSKLRR